MNDFIREYSSRLSQISSEQDIANLYTWFYQQRNRLASVAENVNTDLGLKGDGAFVPLMPVLTVGSPRRLVILSAQPSASGPQGENANRYCRRSLRDYHSYTRYFFRYCADAEGGLSGWWTRALRFVKRAVVGAAAYDPTLPVEDLWRWAHECDSIGGWELFPLWSRQDDVSEQIRKHAPRQGWIALCAQASIRAALRLRPRVLFIASAEGYRLATDTLLPEFNWHQAKIGGTDYACCPFEHESGETTVIFALAVQLFAKNAFKTFTYAQLIEVMQECGIDYGSSLTGCP